MNLGVLLTQIDAKRAELDRQRPLSVSEAVDRTLDMFLAATADNT